MKIAQVTPYDWAVPGGVNTHISFLRKNLKARGHSVKILAPCSSRTKPNLEDLVEEDFIVMGTHVVGHPSSGSKAHITWSPNLFWRVKKVLEEERFDVVHIHEPFTPLLSALTLFYSNGANVGTFHAARENGKYFRYKMYGALIRRILLPRLDTRICVSKSALETAHRYFPGEYKIIPNGVDIERFSPENPPREEFIDGKLNILYVGRFEKRKGLDYLLDAYAVLAKGRKDTRLIVVGGKGNKPQEYREKIRRRGLENVVFTGYVPDNVLPEYYATADIFCAPNTGNESLGIVLLEAMASGKPIVASRISGFKGVITHGVEGLLVQPRHINEIAYALLLLCNNKELRLKMGELGRKTAEERYSWPTVTNQIVGVYESVQKTINTTAKPF